MGYLSKEGCYFTLVDGSVLTGAKSRESISGAGEGLIGVEVGVLARRIIGVLEDLLEQIGCHI